MVHKLANLSNPNLWSSLYNEFNSNVCSNCFKQASSNRDMSNPQPMPYIGSDFGKDPFGLFFCGIETYSNFMRDECPNMKYEIFPTSQVKSLYFERNPEKNNYSPFWKWVRTISEGVMVSEFGEPFKHIAYSNLIKCQSRPKGYDFLSSSYSLSCEIATNCVRKAGWIYRETKQIRAKNIIVFAGVKKEFYLARLFLNDLKGSLIRKFDYNSVNSREAIREKRKGKDLFLHLRDGDNRFIVTNHPQGTPHEIRDEIVRVIRENDWTGSMEWWMPEPQQSK